MCHSLLGSKSFYKFLFQSKENAPMGKTTFTITPGAVIELIGNEAVVMLPGSTSVMRVSEEQAHTLRAIEAGHYSGLSAQTVESLIDAGIVVTHTGMSRRNLVKAGAIGAGAGIAVMAMPGVAAASSGPAVVNLTGTWVLRGQEVDFIVDRLAPSNPELPDSIRGNLPFLTVIGRVPTVPANFADGMELVWTGAFYSDNNYTDSLPGPRNGTFTFEEIVYNIVFADGNPPRNLDL